MSDPLKTGITSREIRNAVTPNWTELADEIGCPLCDYNLRGLQEPRCPECGHAFNWRDLLDPRRRVHPYLFEHHPERNLWSFGRTLFGGLRPGSFWETLHPMQPSSPWRLVLYVLAGVILSALCAVGSVFTYFLAIQLKYISNWNDVLDHVDWASSQLLDFDNYIVFLMPFAWALLTFLSFMIFGTSMQLARVRTVHVVRTVVYAFDAVVVLWMATLGVNLIRVLAAILIKADLIGWLSAVSFIWGGALIAWGILVVFRTESQRARWESRAIVVLGAVIVVFAAADCELWISGGSTRGSGPLAISLCPFFWLLITIRLTYAFRRYLRFPHAVAVILTSQVITVLAMMALTFLVETVLRNFR